MELASSTIHAIPILKLQGRFDAHVAPRVAHWLQEAWAKRPARVIVNLEGVNFADSTALATLVQGMKHCRENGGDLYLCCLDQPVRIIFELTRLDRAFSIFASEQEAVDALAE